MNTITQYPLVKLPTKIDQILYIIREELKSQKYFNTLNDVSQCDNFYQPHFGRLILLEMGLDDSEEVSEFYYKLVEKRSKKIGSDNGSVMKQVMKVYAELVGEKKRIRSSGFKV